MSKFIRHAPCPNCGSSDALAIYEDGEYCFACNTRISGMKSGQDFLAVNYTALPHRRLTKDTTTKYRYGTGVFNGDTVQIAQYVNSLGNVCAQKLRFQNKDFKVIGDIKSAVLFGLDLCKPGKNIVITEGEIDAMSVYQACSKYHVASVSVKNGASGAVKDVSKYLETLLEWEKIILAFDQDVPGKKAVEELIKILPYEKTYIAKWEGAKDPNELLQQNREQDLIDAIFNAQQYRPQEFINIHDVIDKIELLPKSPWSYPWPSLNNTIHGINKGQLHVVGAGTGIGKTTFLIETAVHLATNGASVGIIALEDSIQMTALRIAGVLCNSTLYIPGSKAEIEYIKTQVKNLKNVWLYNHFGSLNAETLLRQLFFLRKHLGADVIILDHISILVSGILTDVFESERKLIDYVITNLRSFTEATGAAVICATHLRKSRSEFETGGEVSISDFRGSGALGHLADVALALERNPQDEENKNSLIVRVLKSRLGGACGLVCDLKYNPETGRIIEDVSF